MKDRRLTLAKETLTELGTDELHAVVGGPGTHVTCYTGLTWCAPCNQLINDPTISSVDQPCQTG